MKNYGIVMFLLEIGFKFKILNTEVFKLLDLMKY